MILFISDLHLDASRPAITQAFFKFLKQDARQAEVLYILGDLFELWIGDDDDEPAVIEIQQQLKQLSDSGTKLYFMHGNRDFLIGEQFAKNTGATLLEDPTLVTITTRTKEEEKKENVLLMHGDTLCTKDKDYLAFRAQVRQEAWAKDILAKPLDERRALGRHLRSQSKSMSSRKADDIMDVSEDEVLRVMEKYSATKLIHGHTHRPARHSLVGTDGLEVERIVLGDWDVQGWCLRVEDDFELEAWDIV